MYNYKLIFNIYTKNNIIKQKVLVAKEYIK